MPHIKVQPFNTEDIQKTVSSDDRVLFLAKSTKNDDELIGLNFESESFVLLVKKKEDSYLIKPDSITRPLDINKIKRALSFVASTLKLEILHSNIAISNNKPPLAEQFNKKIKEFENPQFTRENIAIEIGFGSGRHLMYQAKKRPDTLFIGIEIHTPSAQQVLKQIKLQGIENIWIVNYDARLLLEMMPSNSCCDIYVHFPVPWDKKPHRRVISQSFLSQSLRVLKKGSLLELRTDSQKYYQYALEVFSQPTRASFTVEKNKDIEVVSKYEDRWRAQEKNIYTLTTCSLEESKERDDSYNFEFKKTRLKPVSKLPFPATTQVEDGFFIHYEESFAIDDETLLMRVSFGSFDRPEHKYLFFKNGSLSYYPNDPVKTTTNLKAHQKIEELVYA